MTEARAGVDDDARAGGIVGDAHLDTRRVAPVAVGVTPRNREGAAHAPEAHVHARGLPLGVTASKRIAVDGNMCIFKTPLQVPRPGRCRRDRRPVRGVQEQRVAAERHHRRCAQAGVDDERVGAHLHRLVGGVGGGIGAIARAGGGGPRKINVVAGAPGFRRHDARPRPFDGGVQGARRDHERRAHVLGGREPQGASIQTGHRWQTSGGPVGDGRVGGPDHAAGDVIETHARADLHRRGAGQRSSFGHAVSRQELAQLGKRGRRRRDAGRRARHADGPSGGIEQEQRTIGERQQAGVGEGAVFPGLIGRQHIGRRGEPFEDIGGGRARERRGGAGGIRRGDEEDDALPVGARLGVVVLPQPVGEHERHVQVRRGVTGDGRVGAELRRRRMLSAAARAAAGGAAARRHDGGDQCGNQQAAH